MLLTFAYGALCCAMGVAIDRVLRPARVRVVTRATVNMLISDIGIGKWNMD